MKNPYVEFIKLFNSEDGGPLVQIGTMISHNVLKVGDLQLTSDDIYVADYLKENYKRNIIVDGTTKEYTFKNGLKSGDTVALMPIDDKQTFIVLCKVERL